MNGSGICDLHGHFLPGMDDGSPNRETSIKMLEMSWEQGIRRMAATPHYYPVESVRDFLHRRQQAQAQLQEAVDAHEGPLPAYCLGAEVAYRPGIGYAEDLELLCIGSSPYLLLEMPFAIWGKEVVRDVRNMASTRGIIPILAHVERYLFRQKPDVIQGLLEQELLMQMNGSMTEHFWDRRKAKRLLQTGTVQVLGSDCHNTEHRPPDLGKAIRWMEKAGLYKALEDIAQTGNGILDRAMGPA